jgi:hypothetical protein
MGIDLRWEDERGKPLAELLDPKMLVECFLPDFGDQDFPCLCFVDPYGDTVFNQHQITQLISELETLSGKKREPEVERHLQAVLEFVRQTAGKTHTYIRFYGD